MSIIIKCPTPTVGLDFSFSADVRPFGDVSPSPGDEAFVWTPSEGLFLRGKVLSARVSKVNSKASLRIRVSAEAPPGTLTRTELEPHRDSEEPGPLPKLARKLVKNSLNKVAALDADEARFLRKLFGPAKPR